MICTQIAVTTKHANPRSSIVVFNFPDLRENPKQFKIIPKIRDTNDIPTSTFLNNISILISIIRKNSQNKKETLI